MRNLLIVALLCVAGAVQANPNIYGGYQGYQLSQREAEAEADFDDFLSERSFDEDDTIATLNARHIEALEARHLEVRDALADIDNDIHNLLVARSKAGKKIGNFFKKVGQGALKVGQAVRIPYLTQKESWTNIEQVAPIAGQFGKFISNKLLMSCFRVCLRLCSGSVICFAHPILFMTFN